MALAFRTNSYSGENPCQFRSSHTIRQWCGSHKRDCDHTARMGRGPAQAKDGAENERLGERSGGIAGSGEGLMVRLRGLVPLNGAADPLAKINLRDVAQQFPRPADVGKGMTNVA